MMFTVQLPRAPKPKNPIPRKRPPVFNDTPVAWANDPGGGYPPVVAWTSIKPEDRPGVRWFPLYTLKAKK